MLISDDQIAKANRFWASKKVVPLISVYTPTFNTGKALTEAYVALTRQSYKNWEWVIVDDSSTDFLTNQTLEALSSEPNIRILHGWGEHNVGSLKDQASRLCRGEILVELDHDDFLMPDALLEIMLAFDARPDVDYVYGNSAYFNETGPIRHFAQAPQREIQFQNETWYEVLRSDLAERICDGDGPESLWGWKCPYAPLHPQAFRAKAFFELGGYNPALEFAEDYDLTLRFMLHRKWLHINKLLYGYRWNEQNASKTHGEKITQWFNVVQRHHINEIHAFSRKLQTAREDATNFSDVSAIVIDRTGGMAAVETMEAIAQHMPGAQRILVELNNVNSQITALANNEVKHFEDLSDSVAYAYGAKYARNDILFLAALDSPLVESPRLMIVDLKEKNKPIFGQNGNKVQWRQGLAQPTFKISVIIPTFKRTELLDRALASVYAQDIDPNDVEVLVVGDGCPELEANPHLKDLNTNGFNTTIYNLKRNHNDLGAAARNHGILHAKGEYIAYLDDDDVWMPNHLSSLLAAIYGAEWAFAWCIMDGRLHKATGKDHGEVGSGYIMHGRDLIFKYGFWSDDPIKQHFHDWDLVKRWLDAGLEGNCTRLPTFEYNTSSVNPKRAEYLNAYLAHIKKNTK
jgi:glycosyltransferase involved in cell wall biosynthesis